MINDFENKRDALISIVLIASQMRDIDIRTILKSIHNYLDTNYVDYEILIVEDTPGIVPRDVLQDILKEVSSIRFIELSYEIVYEVAVTVGLENSIGDFVIVFNPTQDPIDAIIPMQEKCNSRVDVVIGVDTHPKNTIGYRVVRPFVNKVLDEIGYNIPKNATSFRCLTRNAVNSATKARNYHHQIFVRISNCGLGSVVFEYVIKKAGRQKKGLFNSSKEAMGLLIFNSTKPLRWMSIIGFLGSFFALIVALYSFVTHFVSHNVAEGWSSTMILISVLFMLLFVILSFFGEYLGRLLNDQSKHDSYWVVNERHSSVMVNVNRHNVIGESDDK